MDLMINNVRVFTMQEEHPVLEEGFVGIRDGVYTLVSLVQPRIMARTFIDGVGKTLVPLALLEPLQALVQGAADTVWPEVPADSVLLEGPVDLQDLQNVRLSQICMILHEGNVLWQKAM